jgi:Dolichyl-phosphate-mannose-protein mannosyltransferase
MLELEHAVLLPVGAAILFWPRHRLPDRPHSGRLRLWIPVVAYLAVTLPLAFVVRKGIYNADESAYLFESKAFLAGAVAVKAPPRTAPDRLTYQHDFFFEHHVIHGRKWFGKYPPGWPALLAAGLAVDAGWLVNPLLGLLTLCMTYLLARRLFGEREARIAALLLALSPFFALNAVGYMSHPACAAAVAGAALMFAHGIESQGLRWFVGMFGLLGWAFLIRPYTGAVAGLVLGSALLWSARRNPGLLVRAFAAGGVIGGVAIAGLLLHNRALTGSFLVSPYTLFRAIEHSPDTDFHVANILHNVRTIAPVNLSKTVLDAAPFVFLLAASAVLLERRFWTGFLAAFPLALFVGHLCLVEASDSIVGERYYAEGYFAVAILAARGWVLIGERRRVPVSAAGALVAGLAAVQVFHYGLLTGTILRLKTGYGRVLDAVAGMHLDRALVLMEPAPGFGPKNFNPNAADWEREPVFYLRDPGPARRTEIACALGRPQWVVVSYSQDYGRAVIVRRGDAVCQQSRVLQTRRAIGTD